MLRQDKERIVSELAERLKSSQNLLVADYRGLTMPEINELRSKLLESGARFSVVKNTLTKRAAEEAGVQQLLELIDGPTAIAFIDPDGDPAAAAKILNDTARVHDVLVIRGGLLDGDTVSDAEVKRLATLPPADVVRAQFAGAVAAPLTTIVGLFTAPLRDLVGVLDARIKQLEEQGETVPEPSDLDHKETEPEAAAEPVAEAETQASAEEPTADVATPAEEAVSEHPGDLDHKESEPEAAAEPASEAEASQEELATEAEAPRDEPAQESNDEGQEE